MSRTEANRREVEVLRVTERRCPGCSHYYESLSSSSSPEVMALPRAEKVVQLDAREPKRSGKQGLLETLSALITSYTAHRLCKTAIPSEKLSLVSEKCPRTRASPSRLKTICRCWKCGREIDPMALGQHSTHLPASPSQIFCSLSLLMNLGVCHRRVGGRRAVRWIPQNRRLHVWAYPFCALQLRGKVRSWTIVLVLYHFIPGFNCNSRWMVFSISRPYH